MTELIFYLDGVAIASHQDPCRIPVEGSTIALEVSNENKDHWGEVREVRGFFKVISISQLFQTMYPAQPESGMISP